MNPTSLVIEALCAHLETGYRATFGDLEPRYPHVMCGAVRIALGHLSNTDALYHDVQHTVQVTLAGQEILRGLHMAKHIDPEDWLHFIVSVLFHDSGYVRGACYGDTQNSFVIDAAGNTVTPPRGASDAWLTPYHVDRSKIFVRERGKDLPFVDVERVAAAIEHTRFPVPDVDDYQATDNEPGLVRAADLIGQLGDPLYLRKINNLYHEFVETGTAQQLGYDSSADLADDYPNFFWSSVRPYIGDALHYLQLTPEGKQWVANLYGHVFAVEHDQQRLGPHRGAEAVPAFGVAGGAHGAPVHEAAIVRAGIGRSRGRR
ncbi:MAG: metal-dependent phosphohydrolase [Pseudomonadota bacterium]